ncbi:PAS domain-containing hybrid sensor histidine kinase/response regulator [Eubacterium oxidoreducens]|uniref:Stage 0 sporulation protein A homolog n=1 Tax=Eubacterium oxidoreducens TaxID=1732 RepID=A0A1G6A5J0_EUBOX|nr:PAS domain-containing hybrid sensor histidine kinase/response regulator [Eubacterium oxidoreducens]SDB03580.1 PAS domain S-box-containing protein [Eubacterium oxidoreducens]
MIEKTDFKQFSLEDSGELIPGGFFIFSMSEDEKLIYCNKRMAQIFGCDNPQDFMEYIEYSFQNIVHPQDYKTIKGQIEKQVDADEEFRENLEYRIVRKDGQIRSVMANNRLMLDEKHGKVLAVVIHDVTECQMACKKEVKLQSDVIRTLTKLFYVSYYVNLQEDTFIELAAHNNPVGEVISKCDKASAALRLSCETNILSKYREEMLEFTNLDTLEERMKNHVFITHDFEGICAGWLRGYFIEGKRDENQNLTHVIWTMKTINEEKEKDFETSKQLKLAYSKAEAASNAKTTFLLNMSHDIRTPINAIIGYANLLESHKADAALQKRYIDNIQESGNTLLKLIDNVLQMAKIETGHIHLYEEPANILEVGKRIGIIFAQEYKKKNLRIVRDIKPVHPNVYMDVSKIEQIILNILSNAIKYTQNGGTIMLSVNEWNCEKPGYSYYKTVFRDNGIGMSKDFQSRLFDTFTRECSVHDNGIPGTGLGIGITKKLVELMNGTVYVESDEGKGTRVEVILPLRRVEPEEIIKMQETKKEAINPTILQGKQILVAEDNELNREIVAEILKDAGMKVDAVEDGVECLARLEKQPPGYYDMILMDIQMPNMDGYKTTQRIRMLRNKVRAQIPIVAVTANVFGEENLTAQKMGMNGFAIKPIDKQALFTSMINALPKA